MPINFPDAPSSGDTHTVGDKTWTYDGTAWNLVTSSASDHGNLGGLGDDDHTQYLLADGTRDADHLNITNDLFVSQDAEIDGTLTANHIHGNIAGSVYLHVKNTSGVTIPEGSPVYATGSVGASGATEVAASDASTAATMPALGITQSELAANAEGHATILGVIGSLDTSTYGLNDSLYVAPGGGLTDTRPTALTDLVQKIGRVVRVDGSTGEILVLGAGRANDVPNNVVAGGLTIDTNTLHVDSTNNRVGIGTTTPDSTLHVDGIVKTGNLTVWGDGFDDTTLSVVKDGEGTVSIKKETGYVSISALNAAESAYQDVVIAPEGGNVGIGTTTPAGKLHISASNPTIWLTDTDTNADSYVSSESSVGSLILSADENNERGSTQIAFKIDGSTMMGLQASGNLEMLGGTVKGDGALVQMVSATSGATDITSAANVASITMSPKYSDSTMLVLVNYHVYKYNSSGSVNNQYQLYQSGGAGITPLRNYTVWNPGNEYMYIGVVSGTIAAGSTSSRTYHFYASASSSADRLYFYWKTIYVLEIAT